VLQPVLKLFQQASSVLGLVFKDISAIWQKTTPQFGTALHQLQAAWRDLMNALQTAMPLWNLLRVEVLVVAAVLVGYSLGYWKGYSWG